MLQVVMEKSGVICKPLQARKSPMATIVLSSRSFGHPICRRFSRVLTCQKLQISGWEWLTILSSFPCGRSLRSSVTWIHRFSHKVPGSDRIGALHCHQASEHCFCRNSMEFYGIVANRLAASCCIDLSWLHGWTF